MLDADMHSFVVKIWLEDKEEAGQVVWRGRITHVASGERRFVKDMNEISSVIWAHLQKMGVRPSFGWRLLCWLSDRKLRSIANNTNKTLE